MMGNENREEFEQLIFTSPLYKKREIVWNEFEEHTIKPEPYEEFQQEIYKTYYPKDFQNLLNFISYSGALYGKCPHCNRNMAFIVEKNELDKELLNNCIQSYCESQIDDDYSYFPDLDYVMRGRISILMKNGGYFDKILKCPICQNVYKFSFKIIDLTEKKGKLYMEKIGQYPSLYDLSNYNQNSYDALLKKIGALQDLRTGIRLHTDGFYIAAYTHFRRVLELFIKYKFKENESSIQIDFKAFSEMRMNEKLGTLKDYLPEFLYNNSEIYGVLSAGIHALSEDECQENFEIVRNVVEAILMQEEANRQKKNILKKTSSGIKKMKSQIEKNSTI